MRVLQVCTNYRPGGIQRHVLELSDSLRKKGHKVFLSGSPGPWMDVEQDECFMPLDLNKVSADSSGSIFTRMRHAITDQYCR
jgi:hypothetical protein